MEFDLFNLLLVLLVAWIMGALATRLGFPSILGELAAGIIFGPALLGIVEEGVGLAILAEVGVFLLLLYIGMEVNYRELLRVSRSGLMAALAGFLIPLVVGTVGIHRLGYAMPASVVAGLAMGVTSLTILSRILVDLKLLGTRVANVMIAGSLIADTLGLVAFGTLLGVIGKGEWHFVDIFLVLFKAVLFFGLIGYLGFKVMPVLGRLLKTSGFTERKANFTLVVLIGLVFAGLAELAGLHSILGAFLAGLFVRGEVLMRKMSHEVTSMVHDISLGFLAPLFFVSAGFHVDLGVLFSDIKLLLTVLTIALVSKTLGTALFYIPSRAGFREIITLGVGMNVHGAVEIIVAEIAFEMGVIGKDLFSIIVFMAVFTTVVMPVLLKLCVSVRNKGGTLARADENRKGIIFAGAPPLARLMAKELAQSEDVWLIDRNINRCRAAEAEGLRALHGNALDEDVLDIVDASNAHAFIAMTPNAEVNAIALERAEQFFGVPELYATGSVQTAQAKDVSANPDEGGGDVRLLYGDHFNLAEWNDWVGRQQTQSASYAVEKDMELAQLLTELQHKGILPLVVVEGGVRRIPASLVEVKGGSKVMGLRKKDRTEPVEDRFESLIKTCPILDFNRPMQMDAFFTEVSKVLAEKLEMKPEKVFKMLMQREKESSTLLVPGLAVPHIIIPGESRSEIVIARCRDGVTFMSDDTTAQIVFVLAGTKDERNLHLRILSAIAQLFQDPAFEDTALTVESAEELRDVIASTERRRF